jgi:hypothetical protein
MFHIRPKRFHRRANINKELERQRELKRQYGSLGAASPVRKIDPATGKVIAIIPIRKTTTGN